MPSISDSNPIRRYLYLQPQIWHFFGACGCVIVILIFIAFHAYYGTDALQQSSIGKSKGNRSRYSDKSNDINGMSSSKSSKKKDGMSKSSSRGLSTLRFIASLHMMMCLIGNYFYEELEF